MNNATIITWAIAALLTTFIFFKLMKMRRRMGESQFAVYKIIVAISFMVIGALSVILLRESLAHFYWITRLAALLLGILQVFILYTRPWVVRDKYDYSKDSFWPECLFVMITSFLGATAFELSGRLLSYIDPALKMRLQFWDFPALILLPFLIFKFLDIISQTPFRAVENLWLYPIEPFSHHGRPWNNLMHVNFELAKSLKEEYGIFSFKSKPWVQAPIDFSLGEIFRLMVQDRRSRVNLSVLQDLGDEYGGGAKFWWLFSIKVVWWNPLTWFRTPRYLNPAHSIAANRVRSYDVIVARRIPLEGIEVTPQISQIEYDSEKTVILR